MNDLVAFRENMYAVYRHADELFYISRVVDKSVFAVNIETQNGAWMNTEHFRPLAIQIDDELEIATGNVYKLTGIDFHSGGDYLVTLKRVGNTGTGNLNEVVASLDKFLKTIIKF